MYVNVVSLGDHIQYALLENTLKILKLLFESTTSLCPNYLTIHVLYHKLITNIVKLFFRKV